MKKFFLIFAVIFCTAGNCSAENLIFVDSMDSTGYFYDSETVKIESPSVLSVRLAVIKADMNQMYVYNVTIDHQNKTYTINSSKILAYDTRAEIESNNKKRAPRPYSNKSEMNATVKYILNGE